MAAQIASDVVKQARSMGAVSPVDAIANSSIATAAGNGSTPLALEIRNGQARDDTTELAIAGDGSESTAAHGEDSLDVAVDGEFTGDGSQIAVGDASGGSDTDNSKYDGSGTAQSVLRGHIRTGSMKKPAAFKSVSVTKNFLAKAATVAPNVRPGDKASPSQSGSATPLGPRPRLVAKSALGGAGSRASLTNMAGSNGPDPMTVWNKNRPVPPPIPRQFTDEELKQQYGIHMATRLQADESGKESKWADIDDDEEDWAPETVEWADGTKSNVVAPNVQSPTTQTAEPGPPDVSVPVISNPPVPELVNAPEPLRVPSTKTILKPGVLAANQSKPHGNNGRSPTDKDATLEQPAAPPPAKSPWAKLPPVDKVTPVFPTPPISSSRSTQGPFRPDSHGFDALPPVHTAREIAADTFDRSWQPEDRGTKELFNSRSGRYEPVPDNRRGQYRDDLGNRQPALLQRPSGPDRPGNADTSRHSISDSQYWSRRRTSSNVSSGGRRMSAALASDEMSSRFSPVSVIVADSPEQQHSLPDQIPTPDVHAEGMNLQENPTPVATTTEDPVAVQQRLIRESRERARLNKEQERAKELEEAAAKKERLRLKMEALSQSDSPHPPNGAAVAEPLEEPSSAPSLPVKSAVGPTPKPPVPTVEGEVAQYGLMKVHQPHPVRKTNLGEVAAVSRGPHGYEELGRESSRSPASRQMPPSNSSGSHQLQSPAGSSNEQRPQQLQAQPSATSSDPWKAVRGSNSYNWNNNAIAPQTAGPSNVWGPPQQRERGLGNGTFNNAYNSLAPVGNAAISDVGAARTSPRDTEGLPNSAAHPSTTRLQQPARSPEGPSIPSRVDRHAQLHPTALSQGFSQSSSGPGRDVLAPSQPRVIGPQHTATQDPTYSAPPGFDVNKYPAPSSELHLAPASRNVVVDPNARHSKWTTFSNTIADIETQNKLADLERLKRDQKAPAMLDDDTLKHAIRQFGSRKPDFPHESRAGHTGEMPMGPTNPHTGTKSSLGEVGQSTLSQSRHLAPHLRSKENSNMARESNDYALHAREQKPAFGNPAQGSTTVSHAPFGQKPPGTVVRAQVHTIGADKGQAASVHVSKFMSFFPPEKQTPTPIDFDCPAPDDVGLFGDANNVKVVLPTPKAIVKLPNKLTGANHAATGLSGPPQKSGKSVALGMIQNLLKPAMTTKSELEVSTLHAVVSLPAPSPTSLGGSEVAATSKPSTGLLFEDREFASLPGVLLPKSRYPNVGATLSRRTLPSVTVRSQTVHTDVHQLDIENGQVTVNIRLPGAQASLQRLMLAPAELRRQDLSNARLTRYKGQGSSANWPRRKPDVTGRPGYNSSSSKARVGSWSDKPTNNNWNRGTMASNRTNTGTVAAAR